MRRKGIVNLLAFGVALIYILTVVASGSSKTSTCTTNTSGQEKAFDPESMNFSVKP